MIQRTKQYWQLCRKNKRTIILVSFAALLGGAAITSYASWRTHRDYFASPRDWASVNSDTSDPHGDQITSYYVHSRGGNAIAIEAGVFAQPPFDDYGIPVVDYAMTCDLLDVGRQYNPVTITQYALENLERFKCSGKQEYRDQFFKMADWLVANHQEGKWYYHFPNRARGIEAPWISAMGQGQGVSVCLRAWQITGQVKYLSVAKKAFNILQTPITEGGVVCRTGTGAWLEEYPDSRHVFNGHVFGLFGAWDMWRVTGDPRAIRLFHDGIAALKSGLDQYDTGYWALYEYDRGRLVFSPYMQLQIEQLKALAALTGDDDFSDRAEKWANYYRSRWSFGRIAIVNGLRRTGDRL